MHPHLAAEYAYTVQADRLAAAARRRPPADGHDVEQLLSTALAGDHASWQALVDRFAPFLHRVARSHGLNRHEAEDAVQETWLRLVRHVDDVRDPRALAGWLRTTVRRESLRVRERSGRERPTADDELHGDVTDAVGADTGSELDAAECREAVARALEALPTRHRTLMLALFGDSASSYEEIAARLDVPAGSIGPIRGRCLARMRRDRRLQEVAEALD